MLWPKAHTDQEASQSITSEAAMAFIIDHSTFKPMNELPDQQIALVKVAQDESSEGWAMAIKIDGQLLWYYGGMPFNEEPKGWLAIHEK